MDIFCLGVGERQRKIEGMNSNSKKANKITN